jgi:MinD superfamily P-loop ATPase
MNISRKDFFKKSLMSLGEAVCAVSGALKTPASAHVETPNPDNHDATPREDLVAIAHNEYCLAKNSGCFSCVERCEPGAIRLVPGVGIRINPQLCTGCGTCEYVCPVTPKAVFMKPRQTE